MAEKTLVLPLIDLSSADRVSAAQAIRQVCLDHGFFYLVNHGVEEEMIARVFNESKKFFALPIEEKMTLGLKEHRGYTPLYAEKLDTSIQSKGDSKESFYIGPLEKNTPQSFPNRWPSEDVLPYWRTTMESYHDKVQTVAKRLLSLIALALNLDEDFFENVGAYPPNAFVRLLCYPGELAVSDGPTYGASAHSDYGMITLLATDGVPGLQFQDLQFWCFQICRGKDKSPQVWEDVHHVNGAFIVNIGDLLERWTNCLFRSTLHRVMTVGQARYSVAFFCDPKPDCLVECLESCCSETSTPRFPPIRGGDYLLERLTATRMTT